MKNHIRHKCLFQAEYFMSSCPTCLYGIFHNQWFFYGPGNKHMEDTPTTWVQPHKCQFDLFTQKTTVKNLPINVFLFSREWTWMFTFQEWRINEAYKPAFKSSTIWKPVKSASINSYCLLYLKNKNWGPHWNVMSSSGGVIQNLVLWTYKINWLKNMVQVK